MNIPIEYLEKILKIAKIKYELDEEVVTSFEQEIEECFKQGFTPRRTVEIVADRLFN